MFKYFFLNNGNSIFVQLYLFFIKHFIRRNHIPLYRQKKSCIRSVYPGYSLWRNTLCFLLNDDLLYFDGISLGIFEIYKINPACPGIQFDSLLLGDRFRNKKLLPKGIFDDQGIVIPDGKISKSDVQNCFCRIWIEGNQVVGDLFPILRRLR